MKKLISSLVLILAAAFLLTACSPAAIPSFLSPWFNSIAETGGYERSEFAIELKLFDADDKGTAIATGTRKYTLKKLADGNTEYTDDLSVTYLPAAGDNAGKKDTVKATVIFNGSLKPVSLKKEAVSESSLSASYTLNVGYGSRTEADFTLAGEEKKTTSLKASATSGAYDSEMMYLIPRSNSLAGVKSGSSYAYQSSFSIFSAKDYIDNAKSGVKRTISYTMSASPVKKAIPQAVYDSFVSNTPSTDTEIETIMAAFSNGSVAYYSIPMFKGSAFGSGNDFAKVMVGFETEYKDAAKLGAGNYIRTVYTMTDYSRLA